jgi:hypothetical protein
MGRQISIWFQDETERLLSERTQKHEDAGLIARYDSRSRLIAGLIARYDEVVRRSIPQLAEKEWMLVADALNGIWLLEEPRHVHYIELEIADAIRLNKLDSKWEVDGAELNRKIHALDYAGRLSIVDAVERLWCDPQADFAGKLREWGVLA